jgi:hypothetical protein
LSFTTGLLSDLRRADSIASLCDPPASKATILPATDIPVPKDKFESEFGESYDAALQEGRICNAMEACAVFGCSPEQLDEAWQKTKAHKFGGGFYCGRVTLNGKSLYVFNAFFMSMRAKFVAPGTSIYCFEVEWSPEILPWSDFRGKVLGPTDPAQAPAGSLRQLILQDYVKLGLSAVPNKGDNGVHASASPFEGLAEKSNWLSRPFESEAFGKVRSGRHHHARIIDDVDIAVASCRLLSVVLNSFAFCSGSVGCRRVASNT